MTRVNDERFFVTENKAGLTRHEKRRNLALSNKKNTRGVPAGFSKRSFDAACAERAKELRIIAEAEKRAKAAEKRAKAKAARAASEVTQSEVTQSESARAASEVTP